MITLQPKSDAHLWIYINGIDSYSCVQIFLKNYMLILTKIIKWGPYIYIYIYIGTWLNN